MHLNLEEIIKQIGYLGIFSIVFAESGLFFGFFLPGDSLLFIAGLLASQNFFNVIFLWLGCFLCAVVGDSIGYAFGKRVGPKLFVREDSWLFHRKHIARAQHFYEKHGKKTIILARFIPVVRTFAPIVAGIGTMDYRTFLTYNVVGGFLWTTIFLGLGFFFGNVIPNVERYTLVIVFVIIIVSLIPILLHRGTQTAP